MKFSRRNIVVVQKDVIEEMSKEVLFHKGEIFIITNVYKDEIYPYELDYGLCVNEDEIDFQELEPIDE